MSRKKSWQQSRGQGGAVFSKPPTYLSVYCVGSAEQPHDKWRIASFHPEVQDGALVWHAFTGHYYEPDSPYAIDIAGNVAQWLDGNEWVSHRKGEHNPEVFYGPHFRVRWNLECQECGMRKAIARPSSLYESFTVLAQLGIEEVELIHLVHNRRHAAPQ